MPAPAVILRPRAPAARGGNACVDEAEAVLRGEFRLFSHRVVSAGFPPAWNRNQLTGERVPPDRHWTELGDFAFGDIKGVWELSRFPWAFALARAYGRTGDDRFKDAFWRLFADWRRSTPPNVGPNWRCGQEATFRLMAVTFAAETMGVPDGEQAELARFVVATGRRISANLAYALSQKNNHGVSECVGLITAALLAPGHGESAGWLRRGLRELERQLKELVYADGGFAQHSLIYHRVLLHDLCWCRSRLGQAASEIPGWLDAAGRRALAYFTALVDPQTGQAPLYGANDGANVLPLADAGFSDLRPVVQMAAAVFRGELPLPAGPWDEAAAWMRPGAEALPRVPWAAAPDRWQARHAGCLQLRNGRGRLFLRCPESFRHRPSQADMLHADIWLDGQPVAHDGGSYSYNAGDRFAAFGAAAQHNVLTVDGREPMEKLGRFLYLPWPTGRVREIAGGGFAASHDGYRDLGVSWTREVRPGVAGGFLVRDRVAGVAGRTVRWHWRLTDAAWHLGADRCSAEGRLAGGDYLVSWRGAGECRVSLTRAETAGAYGWWSPNYGSTEPAWALLIEVEAKADVELVTEFSPSC